MEAKDTVMSDWQIAELYGGMAKYVDVTQSRVAEAQAEISFKAGKQEGITEVVEWFTRGKMSHNSEPFYRGEENRVKHFMIPVKDLRAKLKEWHINA